jgi:hypothetical protein
MSISMKGAGVGPQLFGTHVTISFESVDGGWTQARIRAVPSAVTAAATRDDAREMAIDALMESLAIEPAPKGGAEHGRVRLDVLTVRALDHDSGREL